MVVFFRLLSLWVLLSFVPAHAAVPLGQTCKVKASNGVIYSAPGDTSCYASALLVKSVIWAGAPNPTCTLSYPSVAPCTYPGQYGGFITMTPIWSASCPANSTPAGSQCVCTPPATEQGGACVPPAPDVCAASNGAAQVVNFTAGWQRTPSTAAGQDWLHTSKLPASGVVSACGSDGCKQSFDVNAPCPDCQTWVSQVPNAQGLYRVSVEFQGFGAGESCTAGPADAPVTPSDAVDPPCPGYVGSVNGVQGCYGTASAPIIPVPVDPKLDKNGKEKGNPAAGNKPASGEGSGVGGNGRTPSAGTGGSAGGPVGAGGSGTKPDGTQDKPGEGKEQANCGAPGQPKCGIDETGTPTKFDGDGKALDDWKATMDSNRATIKESGDGVFSGMTIFFSAPPVAGCSAFELPRDMGSIDPCNVVDGVRGVMGYIWALGGLFLCLGWIREAV